MYLTFQDLLSFLIGIIQFCNHCLAGFTVPIAIKGASVRYAVIEM